jgi:hypothetical protein
MASMTSHDARHARFSSREEGREEHVPHPLLAMILTNALDAVKARRRGSTLRHAREWMCASDAPGLLGFERTCRDLALDPVVVRRRVGLRRSRGRVVSRRGFGRGPSG